MRIFLIAVLFCPALAWAQAVYESKEPSGVPVYSDQPAPGATPMQLPPPNVIETPKLPEGAGQPATTQAPAYQSLQIVSPENEGTIHSNTGEFEIKVSLSPALSESRGDALMLSINGTALPRKFRNSTLQVLADDWQNLPPAVAETQIQVAVVDSTGKALIQSSPVKFYLRRTFATR